MQKSYFYTPGVRVGVGVHMQNVRTNVKDIETICIFSCILSLPIILIKPLTTKAYDMRASGDCGTSGQRWNNVIDFNVGKTTHYQCCFNVRFQSWNDVVRFQRWNNVVRFQRWNNVVRFQRWNNFVRFQRWNNVVRFQLWKIVRYQCWNVRFRRWNNVIFQRWNNVIFQRWNVIFQCWNVIFQRWNNVDSY